MLAAVLGSKTAEIPVTHKFIIHGPRASRLAKVGDWEAQFCNLLCDGAVLFVTLPTTHIDYDCAFAVTTAASNTVSSSSLGAPLPTTITTVARAATSPRITVGTLVCMNFWTKQR